MLTNQEACFAILMNRKDCLSGLHNVSVKKRDKKEISSEQHKDLSPSGSRPGIMYGLAKVHKIVTDGLPSFRPILSAIGPPTYRLAKFLVPLLEPLTTNVYTIKHSHLQKNFKVLIQNL